MTNKLEFSRSEYSTIHKALAVHYVAVHRQLKRTKKAASGGRDINPHSLSVLAMELTSIEMLFDRISAAFPSETK